MPSKMPNPNRSLLSVEEDIEIVGQANDGREAIALTHRLQPDVILMDVRMPVCDGVIATREIHQRYDWIRILILIKKFKL
ncbi:MAG: response regulator transcription factor [Hydrococcus sp. Prado102]|jgi:YesN/AraC family two-component response regulator|nr:response regulator transcription factor [Hydrococcus sp. Prado102]